MLSPLAPSFSGGSYAKDGDPGRRGFLDGSPSPHVFFVAGACSDCQGPCECDDESVVAAIFEGPMSREQADRLAGLMRDARGTRPDGVVTAALTLEDGVARLTAYWKDRDTLDRYLAVSVPRGVELMRQVGVEPRVRIVDVLELG
jgi:hypothetical protein